MDNRIYHECLQITSQFKFCPNAFRIDMYRGCSFGCKYCFANKESFKEVGTGLSVWRQADFKEVERKFYKALETDEPSKDVLIELLRHRVPLHCGGMSDPFQEREWNYGLTYKLIQLSNKYNYPICFSTKTAQLPIEYYAILNPEIHAFQVSIMGWNDEYIRKWEVNTPTAQERLNFVKTLRDKGFWCSVRIQPVIDREEAERLLLECSDIPSYVSIEHLHIIFDSYYAIQSVLDNCTHPEDFYVSKEGVLEFKPDIKKANLKWLTEIANSYGVKVGAADNDLHYMTQSRCCCGIDTINKNFDNYLKYNSTYFSTGPCKVDEIWAPECNLRKHMNVGKGVPKVYFKDTVKNYIMKNPNVIPKEYEKELNMQLFGCTCEKLF